MPTMTIYRGLPGSGKSTLALAEIRRAPKLSALASADHYFHLPRRSGGDRACGLSGGHSSCPRPAPGAGYDFNPAELVHAHGFCLRTVVDGVHHGLDVFVDNTNTSAVELAPYVALAQAYGYRVDIVHMDTPVDVCLARQTHGVPEVALRAMAARFERDLPPWWPAQRVIQG
jgi:predicted kinase